MPAVKQDKALEIRYTKNVEFTDSVVSEFLSRKLNLFETDFDYPELLTPIYR